MSTISYSKYVSAIFKHSVLHTPNNLNILLFRRRGDRARHGEIGGGRGNAPIPKPVQQGPTHHPVRGHFPTGRLVHRREQVEAAGSTSAAQEAG